MRKSLIYWLMKKLSYTDKKELLVNVSEEILESKTGTIDNETAERIITATVKSVGNKIISFVVRD